MPPDGASKRPDGTSDKGVDKSPGGKWSGDGLPEPYGDQVRKTIDQNGQVTPEDYPDRHVSNPQK